SAAKHALILDNSDDLIAHSGPDGRYTHVSSSYTRLMGWTPAQMIGERVIDFLHPEDRQRAHAALACLVTPEAKPLVTEVRKRDTTGAHISLATKACPVIDPVNGGSLGVVLVSRDITQEQAMRRQLQDMANEKLALVESIDDGFFSVNTRWVITYANGRAAAFVGTDRETAVGQSLWDVAPGLADSTIGAHYRQAMASRESMFFEEFYEPNGVWLSERIYAYKDGLSVFFHDISERKEAEAKLEHLATRDSLTGLPNRAWINGRVDAMLAQSDGESLATVLFIDLNRFKEVNDSLGHAAGDLLLQQVGERLKKCMRPGDVVARLGGDEFVVAARCIGREAAAAIAQRLLTALTTPFHAEGLDMSIGASIGICQAMAGSATTQQLFQRADTAMYKAKAHGTGAYEFFEPSMQAEAMRPAPSPGRPGPVA
ncbi:MAG TPA: diguanylate cyclase, partial [Pseudoduganella sp.]